MTEDDIKYLKENYGIKPLEAIAATLGRSVYYIRRKAYNLNLTEQQWTDIDIAYLKANYGMQMREEIAKKLGRTVGAITVKANQLQLTSKANRLQLIAQNKIVNSAGGVFVPQSWDLILSQQQTIKNLLAEIKKLKSE